MNLLLNCTMNFTTSFFHEMHSFHADLHKIHVHTWKFSLYVNFIDFRVTKGYSENFICENLPVSNN